MKANKEKKNLKGELEKLFDDNENYFSGYTGTPMVLSEKIIPKIIALFDQFNKREEWVSVKKRLPEVSTNHLGNYVIVFSPIYEVGEQLRYRIVDSQFVKTLNDVTHWMPLPEIPQS